MRGFEPLRTDPESAVLPLDDIPKKWLGRKDSNPRIAGPKPGALPLGDCPVSKQNALLMAEREGFEPSVRFLPYTRLAGVRLKPARPPLQKMAEEEGLEPPWAKPGGFQDRCITNYTIPPNIHSI